MPESKSSSVFVHSIYRYIGSINKSETHFRECGKQEASVSYQSAESEVRAQLLGIIWSNKVGI